MIVAQSSRKGQDIRVKFSVPVKALSVNKAWQGRRFSTPAKKQYERAMTLLLPRKSEPGPYYRVAYDFYLVNFALSDVDNMVKPCQDCLVRQGIISDDRMILEFTARKFKADRDRIEVEIWSLEAPGPARP